MLNLSYFLFLLEFYYKKYYNNDKADTIPMRAMRQVVGARKYQEGIALFLTLAVLTILSIVGYGLVVISTVQSRDVNNDLNTNKAYYLSRLGISKAIDEIEHDYWWGTSEIQSFGTEEGTYTISVWVPNSNQTSSNKIWKVVSVGYFGNSSRTLTAWLQLESFAEFAYFTESEKMGSTTIWFTDRDRLEGKVHTNGYFSFYNKPLFSDRVTSHNANDYYYNSSSRLYSVGGHVYTDPSKFYHYYYGYNYDYPIALDASPDFSFAGGQPDIPLPEDTGSIADNANQKIYQDVDLTFLDSGKVKVQTKRTYSRWVRVRRNGRWVWERRTQQSTQTDYYSTDDLTLYVGGDVNLLGGKVKGKVTVGAQGDVYIKDSVTYKDSEKDVLGIVSEEDIIISTDRWRRKDVQIDAILMTLTGSFYVDRYDSGVHRGTLGIFGGLIQYNRGPVGTFNSYTGTVMTGYNKNYIYDKKLINLPPPNFPTTGNIAILSIQDRQALGSSGNSN